MPKSYDFIVVDDGSEQFNLTIEGKIYNIMIKPFGLDEMSYHLKEGNSKKTIAHWIFSSFDDDVDIKFEDIIKQDDTFFEPILSRFINRDNQLKKHYERNSDIDNIYERFYKSYSVYQVESIKDFSNRIISEMKRNIADSFKEYIKLSDTLIKDSLEQLKKQLGEIVSILKTPRISDDKRKEIEINLKKWSDIGWTTPSYVNPNFLFSFPDNKLKQDEIVEYFLKSDRLLFNHIRECENVKFNDFNEAIDNYESGRYKSCIMIVFSLIDEMIIKNQHKDDRKKPQKNKKVGERYIGKGGAYKIKCRVADLNQSQGFWDLFIISTLDCIMKLYEYGDDFKTQPEIINRNFLMHGMYEKNVTRIDCLKVFHLYYNVLTYVDNIFFISLEDKA